MRKMLFRLLHFLLVGRRRREQFGGYLVIVHVQDIGLLLEQSCGSEASRVHAVKVIAIFGMEFRQFVRMLLFNAFSFLTVGMAGCVGVLCETNCIPLDVQYLLRFRANQTRSKCFCTCSSAVALMPWSASVKTLLRNRKVWSSSSLPVGETGVCLALVDVLEAGIASTVCEEIRQLSLDVWQTRNQRTYLDASLRWTAALRLRIDPFCEIKVGEIL